MSRRMIAALLFSLIVLAALILYKGTSRTPLRSETDKEQKEQLSQPSLNPAKAQPESTAPTPAETRAVVERIYQDAAVVDESHRTPFAVGDFNGDRSQDIAIVIKPVKAKLPQINDEYANWIIVDPRHAPPSNAQASTKNPPAPVRIHQNDLLLTVVHGYERAGWRNPAARQTYLLKNAVGDEIKMEPVMDTIHKKRDGGKLPDLRGDVIRATLAGEAGFLYWTGAKYVWHKQ
jgi:hypothetical protein